MDRKPILDAADHLRVSEAVSAAEAHSAGEIVTIVTDRSDSYADVALAWAAFASIAALTVIAFFPQFYEAKIDLFLPGWNTVWTAGTAFTIAALIAVLKFLSVWLLQLWQPLKFWLVPPGVKSERVRYRAITLFKVGAERRTHGRTGVLIYLSMREHRCEIVADEAIRDKVSDDVWGEAMAAMLAQLKGGHVTEGMIAAIERVGAVLTEHFPAHEDNVNELPDRLIEV